MNNLGYIKLERNINLNSALNIFEKSLKKNLNIKTAIFLDKKKKFYGIVTLGDLRRFIKEYSPNYKIYNLINKNPILCTKKQLNHNLNNYIKNELYKRNLNNFDDLIILNPDRTVFKVINYQIINQNPHYKQICVIGLGHIGLTLSIHLLKYFSNIIGFEILPSKIKNIKNNRLDIYEKNLEGLLNNALRDNKLILENDFSKVESQIYIVCVGTNLTSKNLPDNKNITEIIKSLGKKIVKKDLIIIRGTLQVGVSKYLLIKILEKVSKLKCGKDFYFSYMPERIIEGNALEELEQLPQIISAYSKDCSLVANQFAKICFKNNINVNSLEEAEIIKLASNSFRDLNFAFANELTRIANIYYLSGHDLINKANYGYNRNFIKLPSLGVGGFCLPKDPYLFSKLYNNNKSKGYQLAKHSRKINLNSLKILYKKINTFKSQIRKRKLKILFLGIAFKGYPETIDIRNSSSLSAFEKIKREHLIDLFDLMGKKIIKLNPSFKKNIVIKINNLNIYDVVVCFNNNDNYEEIVTSKIKNTLNNKKKLIIDPWKILDQNFIESYGWNYEKI